MVNSVEEDLLSEYFKELSSLIGELKEKRKVIREESVDYTEQEKAKCHALILSAQKMLEIVYFEIHYSDSNTRNYQDFQDYLKYKEVLFSMNEDFSKLVAVGSEPRLEKDGDLEETSDAARKGIVSRAEAALTSALDADGKASSLQNMQEKAQSHYLLQSRRLLEETNQYSQQVLLNLNTQKEQLMGTDQRIVNISASLQDSSQILDKMTKWWHKFI